MSPNFSKDFLRQRASWIRDDLDPRIARDGPDCMQPDDVLTLHELFVGLREADLSISVLRYSRIHVAILEVSGKATRWPKRLAEECDRTIDVWSKKYGKLSDIRPRLFKPDGRLYGVCTGRELTRDSLVKFWTEQDSRYMSPGRGMQHGSLGFKPGDWWINGMFAFHAGIIDLNCTDGGICADKKGAYAVVMKGTDEICTESVDKFRYRCKSNDPGRFRMTAADFHSRYPIRVLRSHTLNSLWSPRSGIRYEGLHTITGWAIKPTDPAENGGSSLLWEVEFQRDRSLDDDTSATILKRPLAEETDDYMEYKRVRKEMLTRVREEILTGIPATLPQTPPPIPAPEKPSFAIQSPSMSPKTERPFFVVGDYCLMREPVLPGSPESPPVSRTSFFQPPPSPRAQTGPAIPQNRETTPQPRSLTVPQNLRKPAFTIGVNTKGKKSHANISPKKASHLHTPVDGDRGKSTKEPSAPTAPTKDTKSSIAKSLTRMFSDGARDSDIPESPFGSMFPGDGGEPASFPFDRFPPLPSPLPPTESLAQPNGTSNDTVSNRRQQHPVLRQVHWGNADSKGGNGEAEDGKKKEKSRHRRRRDRAVYEAFERQECPEPRLLLAALNEVWDDCADPEYPDMVLEEPAVYESNSGYSGGFGGGEGGDWGAGTGSRSDDYMLRIPPGGIDVGRFIAQQAAVGEDGSGFASSGSSGGGGGGGSGVRRSWHAGDGGEYASADSAHEIGSVLRQMSESSATSPEVVARRQSQRLSSGSSSSSGEKGGGLVGARRSSLSTFDTRMPGLGGMGEDGARGRGARRPTIVRFSGLFKRECLEETVDEVVDEGAAGEDANDGAKEREIGKEEAVKEVLERSFGDAANW